MNGRKDYGYGSYFENGKFYDKEGNEIHDIKAFYISQKKKKAKAPAKRKFGYGGDGSYERREDGLIKKDFPENL